MFEHLLIAQMDRSLHGWLLIKVLNSRRRLMRRPQRLRLPHPRSCQSKHNSRRDLSLMDQC
jgi:hypothetical protein